MGLTCPNCRNRVSLLASVCSNCGSAVGSYIKCVRCGRLVLRSKATSKVLAIPPPGVMEIRSYCRKCH